MFNKDILFKIVLLLGIIINMLILFVPVYDDGGAVGIVTTYHDKLGNNYILFPHMLFTTMPFTLAATLLGNYDFVIRSVAMAFLFL